MVASKFGKFLMPILNWQVNSFSSFVSFFIVMTQNSPVKLKLINILLWIKGSHQVPIFRLSNILWWKFAKFLMSFLKAQFSFPSNVASVFTAIKHNSPILYLAQTLYTLLKKSPLKCKFMRFSSAWVKISHVNFELISQLLFKFCIIRHCHDTQFPCKFETHTFLTLDKTMPSSSQFGDFHVLWWKLARFLMSIFRNSGQLSFKFCTNLGCN